MVSTPTSALTNGTAPTSSFVTVTTCTVHTSSTTAVTRRSEARGATSTSRRSGVKRPGKIHPKAIRSPSPTNGGTGTTRTESSRTASGATSSTPRKRYRYDRSRAHYGVAGGRGFASAWERGRRRNDDMARRFTQESATMKSLKDTSAVVIGASSGVGRATVRRLVERAAVAGSPLSGGYAGAKRMQWFMTEYAQEVSDTKKLGIRFFAVLPRQLIEGTEIGTTAAANYGATQGLSAAEFLNRRWKVPLDADKVGAAIVGSLRGDLADGATAIGVTGEGVESLE